MRNRLLACIALIMAIGQMNPIKIYAEELCSPKSNLFIRAPFEMPQIRLPSLSTHPLIHESAQGYTIVYKDQTGKQIIAFISSRDNLGNPTAETSSSDLKVRGQANAIIQPGYIPLMSNKTYTIIERTNDLAKVRFSHNDFTQHVWVSADSILSPPPQDHTPSIPTTDTSLATLSVISNEPPLVTTKGVSYQNYTISRVEPDGLVIRHSSGITKVLFANLRETDQKRFNYDPAKATAFQTEKWFQHNVLKNITATRDDIQEVVWYETRRDIAQLGNEYSTYKVEFYIGKHDNGNLTLRVRTRFFEAMTDDHDPSWIFYESVRLLGDNGARLDITTEYPNKQQDNDRYGLVEWSDNSVPIERALEFKTAQAVKVMFIGRYSHTYNMDAQQLAAFREMIATYEYLKHKSQVNQRKGVNKGAVL